LYIGGIAVSEPGLSSLGRRLFVYDQAIMEANVASLLAPDGIPASFDLF